MIRLEKAGAIVGKGSVDVNGPNDQVRDTMRVDEPAAVSVWHAFQQHSQCLGNQHEREASGGPGLRRRDHIRPFRKFAVAASGAHGGSHGDSLHSAWHLYAKQLLSASDDLAQDIASLDVLSGGRVELDPECRLAAGSV
jgi:hypothetical protein